MNATRGAAHAVVVAVIVAVAGAGCGVPTGSSPREVPRDDVPYGLLDPGGTGRPVDDVAGPGEVGSRVALLSDADTIRLVGRSVPAGSPQEVAETLLAELQTGPSDAERAQGLSSALPAGVRLRLALLRDGVAWVDLAGLESGEAADRLRFAVGQVVLTVTSVTAIDAVRLQRDGHPVDAPDASGALTGAPLTRADYAALLAGGTP